MSRNYMFKHTQTLKKKRKHLFQQGGCLQHLFSSPLRQTELSETSFLQHSEVVPRTMAAVQTQVRAVRGRSKGTAWTSCQVLTSC